MAEDNKLEKLKIEYEKIRKKHNLPEFRVLNEDFHIDKIAENEYEILVREVRRFVGDKIVNYMRFVENLINPSNAPMFIFSMIKLLDTEDKKKLSELYKELMKNEIRFIELDLEFNEEKEAKFIIDSYKEWQGVKKELLKILQKVNGKWDDKTENSKSGYLG